MAILKIKFPSSTQFSNRFHWLSQVLALHIRVVWCLVVLYNIFFISIGFSIFFFLKRRENKTWIAPKVLSFVCFVCPNHCPNVLIFINCKGIYAVKNIMTYFFLLMDICRMQRFPRSQENLTFFNLSQTKGTRFIIY